MGMRKDGLSINGPERSMVHGRQSPRNPIQSIGEAFSSKEKPKRRDEGPDPVSRTRVELND